MEIKVLGPLEAHDSGTSATPSAAKPRQILALLALQVGHEVTARILIEEVWGLHPPRSASATLRTYIRVLRRGIQAALSPAEERIAKEILVTTSYGYRLESTATEVDVQRYERLAASGKRALHAGETDNAARLLRAALNVWRGPMLVDVYAGARLSMEVTRLENSRFEIQQVCLSAELRLGMHHELLGELTALTHRHPTNEKLAEYLMLALYRSGQQWRALEAFSSLRAKLVSELGVEPSARIGQLHHAILNSDPALDSPTSGDWRP